MTNRTQNRANRILVVDDEEAIRQIIVSMLASANFVCREAASGAEALALLESGEEIELMLTDMMMDDMDGIALLERTKECFPSLPVVMVTAVHDISVALQALRNGAFDYILKPFEREQLLATVRRALETSRLKLERRACVANLEAQVAALTEELRGRKSTRSSRWAIFKSKFVAGVLLLGLSLALPATASRGSHSTGGSHSRSSSHVRSYNGSHRTNRATSASTGRSYSHSSSHARTHSGNHHSKRATSSAIKRDSHGRIKRSSAAKHAFERQHPCPSTGRTSGWCPGYVVDHVRPLECGGADAPSNLQWQTVAAGKAKDKTEGRCR